jgi:ABC-2 type transport system ATP-binding protein
VVANLRSAGTTIVLTTHYMDEAQVLADRVAVIATGRIVAEGTPATIGGRDSALTRIRFTLPTGVAAADVPVPCAVADDVVTVEAEEPTAVLHQLTGWALERGTTLPQLSVEQPSLEDIYLRLTGSTGKEPEDEAPAPKPRRRRALARSGR